MNVLVDTSVWSLALRRKKTARLNAEEQRLAKTLSDAIQDGRVSIIGPIRQEILSGIKDVRQFETLRRDLQAYRDEALTTEDYEAAARWYNVCRSHGVECGTVDILICTVAVRRTWQVLTNDSAMTNCLAVMRTAQHRAEATKTQRQEQ
ncbi:MAG: PIN domain-containing protein [Terriglobales bacterium]